MTFTNTPPSGPPPDSRRWTVFTVIGMVYFFVYFHRVSTSVIVTDLLDAFDTNATALGIMSSMYFYLYALEQPVVGVLTDRLGPRRVIGWWSVAAAAGCFLFAAAPGIGWAGAGRALIGLGVGGVYVPALKAISDRFRKSEFTTMVGLLMSVGNTGAVIATTPLAWAAAAWGWRATFVIIGAVTLALAVAAFRLAGTPGQGEGFQRHASASAEIRGTGQTAAAVLGSVRFWTVAAIFFGVYGTLVTFQGLWATPFLMAAFGAQRIMASQVNMLIPIGVIVGAPVIGRFNDRLAKNRHHTLVAIVGLYTATWIAVAVLHRWLGMAGIAVALLIMGMVAGGFISVLWGIVRETTPARILGMASGLLNVSPFLGVAAFQVVTGALLDRAGRVGESYTLAGYHQAFFACLAGIVFCLVLSVVLSRMAAPAAEQE